MAAGRDWRPDAEVGAGGDARRRLLENAQPGFLAEHEERVHHIPEAARREIATAVSSIASRRRCSMMVRCRCRRRRLIHGSYIYDGIGRGW